MCIISLLCMSILYQVQAVFTEARKGVRSQQPRLQMIGCWESNPDPLQEQPVFVTTEPSFIPFAGILIHHLLASSTIS